MAEWYEAQVQRAEQVSAVGPRAPRVIMLTSHTKYCFPYFEILHMVFSTIIRAVDCKTYRQDGRVVRGDGSRHQSIRRFGFKTHSCHFIDIPIQILFLLF